MRKSEAILRGLTLHPQPEAFVTDSMGRPFQLEPQGYYQDVQDFHDKFGITRPTVPTMLDEETYVFRQKFMQEEIDEFEAAYLDLKTGIVGEAFAMHEMADALADLIYVAVGTADMMGINLDAVWKNVQNANMAKVRAKSADDSKRGTALDVIKPKGWTAPNHYKVLGLEEPK